MNEGASPFRNRYQSLPNLSEFPDNDSEHFGLVAAPALYSRPRSLSAIDHSATEAVTVPHRAPYQPHHQQQPRRPCNCLRKQCSSGKCSCVTAGLECMPECKCVALGCCFNRFGKGTAATEFPIATTKNANGKRQRKAPRPPPIDLFAPAVDMSAPAVDMSAPAVDMSAPAVDMSAPAVDMVAPAVDMAAPAVDMAAPAVDMAAPSDHDHYWLAGIITAAKQPEPTINASPTPTSQSADHPSEPSLSPSLLQSRHALSWDHSVEALKNFIRCFPDEVLLAHGMPSRAVMLQGIA